MDFFKNTKNIVFDITSNCKLQCAQCVRNQYGYRTIENLDLVDLSFEDFRMIVDRDIVDLDLHMINFQSGWGDPCANDDLINMLGYLAEKRNDLVVKIGTSAYHQDKEFYKKLANELNKFYFHTVDVKFYGFTDNCFFRVGTDDRCYTHL